jgi:hypothetical protein
MEADQSKRVSCHFSRASGPQDLTWTLEAGRKRNGDRLGSSTLLTMETESK